MRWIALIFLFVPAAALAAEQPVAIRDATVETLGLGGRIEGATVLLRDGKIAAVGRDVAIPANARVIDADGGTLMPGVIDPYFEVSVAAATADAGARTVVVGGRNVTIPGGFGGRAAGAFTRIADNFYPYDGGFKPLARLGLTRLNLVSSGVGQAAIIRVTPGEPEGMMFRADGLPYASVTNSTESLDQLRSRLARGGPGGARPGGPPRTGATPGGQLFNDVASGKVPIIVEAANAAAVLHLLKALDGQNDVKLVLYLSGDVIAETLPALKERKAFVVLRPTIDLLPNTRDRFNAARMLHEAGVDFALTLTSRPRPAAPAGFGGAAQTEAPPPPASIDPEFPFFQVAVLVKTGLPRQAALEAVAKKPAALLGMGDTHGTIEPGKAADLLLFTGDPLDPASQLRSVFVDGRITHAN